MVPFARILGCVLLAWLFTVCPLHASVIYLTNSESSQIDRVGSAGTVSTLINANLDKPAGLAANSSGFIFVTNYATGDEDGEVLRFPPGNGNPATLASELNGPTGIAVASNGTVFVAISGDDNILRISNTGELSTFASLPEESDPRGICLGGDGTLYVACYGSNSIAKITAAGVVNTLVPSISEPIAVALNLSGSLCVAHGGASGAVAIVAQDGSASPLLGNLDDPVGLCFDLSGKLYVACAGDLSVHTRTSAGVTDILTDDLDGAGNMIIMYPRKEALLSTGDLIDAVDNWPVKSIGDPACSDQDSVAVKVILANPIPGTLPATRTCLLKLTENAAPELLALIGEEDFNTEGAKISGFSDPLMSSLADAAYRVSYKGGDTTPAKSVALYFQNTLVVRKGDDVDGFDEGVKFLKLGSFGITDNNLVFQAAIGGPGIKPGNNTGIWDDFFNVLLRTGDTVSGITEARVKSFKFLKPSPFCFGHSRSVAPDGTTSVLASLSDLSKAVLLLEFGGATVIAQTGEILDSAPLGAKIQKLGLPSVASGGDAVFRATLAPGSSGLKPGTKAIFLYESGTRMVLATSSEFAPGTGGLFQGFSDPVINSDGVVAFRGTLKQGFGVSTTNNSGIWCTKNGSLDLVAQTGSASTPAPGAADGTLFSAFQQFCLPDGGGVFFLATVTGPSVTLENNQGIWAQDDDGTLQRVINKGELLLINGNFNTVGSFSSFRLIKQLGAQARNTSTEGNVALTVKCGDGSQALVLVSFP